MLIRTRNPKVTASIIVFVLAAAGTAQTGGAAEEQHSAVASVNGVFIPESYLVREIARFEKEALGQQGSLDDAQKAQLDQEALKTLINMELLFQESQRRGFLVEPDRIEEQVESLRSRFSGGSEFADALLRIGITEEELRIEIERQTAIQDMIDGDISTTVAVSLEESRDYYDSNLSYFTTPEQVRARHILIRIGPDAEEAEEASVRNKIEQIRQRVAGGEDFAELAVELSEDSSGASGGDLGFFQKEQVAQPFADAAFTLEVGEISQAVRTEYGYHLIQVTDRKAEALIPFEQIQERVTQFLEHEKVMQALEELVSELRRHADIVEYPSAARKSWDGS